MAEETNVNEVVENEKVTKIKRLYEMTPKELSKLDQVRVKLEIKKTKKGFKIATTRIKLDQYLVIESSNKQFRITETMIRLCQLDNNIDQDKKEFYITVPMRMFKGKVKYEDDYLREYYRAELLLSKDNVLRGFLSHDEKTLFDRLKLKYKIYEDDQTVETIDDDF